MTIINYVDILENKKQKQMRKTFKELRECLFYLEEEEEEKNVEFIQLELS